MNKLLRFDGRVAVVTGAGGGLGRAYALLLAERGAKVVVNDLGGSRHGEGQSTSIADQVVNEIKAKGGEAAANYDSVSDGHNIIQSALDRFGRIDILINNAGILRDKSFLKMSLSDWTNVQQVHLEGSFRTTHAAWEHFRKQNYGRVVMTSSASGLLGNFGQANYSAAKAGLVGLAQTLAKEGSKFNIHTNTIVPVAASRMTEDIFPPDFLSTMKPELIAPVVCWLCHESCVDNGSVIESTSGAAAKYHWMRGPGALLRSSTKDEVTLEGVQAKWDQVTNLDKSRSELPKSVEEMTAFYLKALEKMSKNAQRTEPVTRLNLMDHDMEETEFKYDSKDTILYALGLGMSVGGDVHGLNYLYENSPNFRIFPTFPTLMCQESMGNILSTAGLGIDWHKILHGEEYLEIYRQLPSSGTIRLKPKVVDVLDKITGTLFIMQVEGSDEDGPLFMIERSIFERDSGKFGGRRGTNKVISKPIAPPKRAPDQTLEFKTTEDQAALYRLNGDENPLHIDPEFAQRGGFSVPILHGLCSFGIAARLILQKYANGDPAQFKAIKVRFSKPILPGDTLQVDTWLEGTRVHFEGKAKGSSDMALSDGYVDLVAPVRKASTA